MAPSGRGGREGTQPSRGWSSRRSSRQLPSRSFLARAQTRAGARRAPPRLRPPRRRLHRRPIRRRMASRRIGGTIATERWQPPRITRPTPLRSASHAAPARPGSLPPSRSVSAPERGRLSTAWSRPGAGWSRHRRCKRQDRGFTGSTGRRWRPSTGRCSQRASGRSCSSTGPRPGLDSGVGIARGPVALPTTRAAHIHRAPGTWWTGARSSGRWFASSPGWWRWRCGTSRTCLASGRPSRRRPSTRACCRRRRKPPTAAGFRCRSSPAEWPHSRPAPTAESRRPPFSPASIA